VDCFGRYRDLTRRRSLLFWIRRKCQYTSRCPAGRRPHLRHRLDLSICARFLLITPPASPPNVSDPQPDHRNQLSASPRLLAVRCRSHRTGCTAAPWLAEPFRRRQRRPTTRPGGDLSKSFGCLPEVPHQSHDLLLRPGSPKSAALRQRPRSHKIRTGRV
jgi:hypothetical protein